MSHVTITDRSTSREVTVTLAIDDNDPVGISMLAASAVNAALSPLTWAVPTEPQPTQAEIAAHGAPADAGLDDLSDVDKKLQELAETAPKRRAARSATKTKATSASATDATSASVEESPGPSQSSDTETVSSGLDDVGELDGPSGPSASQASDLDDLGDILTASAPEISDAELAEAVIARNKVIKNVDAVKALIGSYSGGVRPFHAQNIPQNQRADFIERLGKLPKAG
jgi:hypothetical protein